MDESATESKVGRPSSYKPEYCQQIIDYFSVKPYEREIKVTEIDHEGKETKTLGDLRAADFPSFAGFAASIGVHRETLLNWCEAHPEFFDAYKRAKDLQENFVIVNGNHGLINPAFGIFTAKNVLGWRDKQPGEEDKVNVNLTNNLTSMPDSELDRKWESAREQLKAELLKELEEKKPE